MNKIKVLSMGPGAPEYLLPSVREQARHCDLLVGGKRNLALFDFSGQEKLEIKGDLEPILALIRERAGFSRVGVLVSGDAGLYSLLPRLVEFFGGGALEVYPGISAVQYMFARLGLPWHDARIVSLHGRRLNQLPRLAAAEKKLVLFTDGRNTPAAVCRVLVAAGLNNKKICVGEDLSYPEEKITCGKPKDFCRFRGSDLNLMVILEE